MAAFSSCWREASPANESELISRSPLYQAAGGDTKHWPVGGWRDEFDDPTFSCSLIVPHSTLLALLFPQEMLLHFSAFLLCDLLEKQLF